ncbi:MAG: NAD-dependent malic enzyme [Nitrospinae bacterium]|nr:NAD-dependent malic enzyme [Nitrospinota bacterium]
MPNTAYRPHPDANGDLVVEINKSGQDIIHNPLLNKGTAFTQQERDELGLEGLLPPHVATLAEQLIRVKENYDSKPNPIEKYIQLRSLQDRNEILFYSLLRQNIKEMIPVIYTPTVGDAVEKHGHIYRNARGLFITLDNIYKMDEMCANLPTRDIDIIVVTDSQGILGIGDQGVGGMAIPIGKLSLYTVAAGIHPAACLPITLDVGTDNQKLLADPLYLGRKHRRLTGKPYADLIDLFVKGVKRNFPNAILQWEDFSKQNAFSNMDNYRDALPSFNDDVQGTAAVVLGGIIGAMKIKKQKLRDQRYAIYGAGAAGIGIARQLRDGLMADGLNRKEAQERIFVVDSQGLLLDDREGVEDYKKEFAQPESATGHWIRDHLHALSLEDTVKNGKVTVLIGVSAQPGSFTNALIDQMIQNTPEPVIFTLSNPTSKCEADPRKVLEYTGGAAIVAAGSPFAPVTVGGREFHIGQGNNAFVFPGLGLGALSARAKKVTNGMFTASAHALAKLVSDERLANRTVYPPIEDLFEVSFQVALAVYKQALTEGVGTPLTGDPEDGIRDRMWIPDYPKITRKK